MSVEQAHNLTQGTLNTMQNGNFAQDPAQFPLQMQLVEGEDIVSPETFEQVGMGMQDTGYAVNAQAELSTFDLAHITDDASMPGNDVGTDGHPPVSAANVYKPTAGIRKVRRRKPKVRFVKPASVPIDLPPSSVPVTSPGLGQENVIYEGQNVGMIPPQPITYSEVNVGQGADPDQPQPLDSYVPIQPPFLPTPLPPNLNIPVTVTKAKKPPSIHGLDEATLVSLDTVTFAKFQRAELQHLYAQDFGFGTAKHADGVKIIQPSEMYSCGRDNWLSAVYKRQIAAQRMRRSTPSIPSPTAVLPEEAAPLQRTPPRTFPHRPNKADTRAFLRTSLPDVNILADDLDAAAANLNRSEAANANELSEGKNAGSGAKRKGCEPCSVDGQAGEGWEEDGGNVGQGRAKRQRTGAGGKKNEGVTEEEDVTKEEALRRKRALRNRESARRSRQKTKIRYQEMEKDLARLSTQNAMLNGLLKECLPGNMIPKDGDVDDANGAAEGVAMDGDGKS